MTRSNDEFLAKFFAPPNEAWPQMDTQHRASDFLQDFLKVLDTRDERPLILPRRQAGIATIVAICWDVNHAARMRPVLEASVAHSLAQFDGVPLRLKGEDPIEAAILDLVGPATTYELRPSEKTSGAAWRALRTLVTLLEERPHPEARQVHSTSRMLRDFELALSNGQVAESAVILERLEREGGVSLENLAFLQIRRLSKLGMDSQLLMHPQLPNLVFSEPPDLIRDAILSSWFRLESATEEIDTDEKLTRMIGRLDVAQPDIAMLVPSSIDGLTSRDALLCSAVVAIARKDLSLAVDVMESVPDLPEILHREITLLIESTPEEAGGSYDSGGTTTSTTTGQPTPDGLGSKRLNDWVEWAGLILSSPEVAPTADEINELGQPYVSDLELADVLEVVPDSHFDALMRLVAAFIDADEYDEPAWRSASVLLGRYLLEEQFSPQGVSTMHSLLDINLRSGPSAVEYERILLDIGEFAERWVSVAHPETALDFSETIAISQQPNRDAAQAFVAGLLGRLHAQSKRLSQTSRASAQMTTEDLGLDWVWEAPDSPDEPVADPWRDVKTVLLYSLNPAVLDRVRRLLLQASPRLTVHMASDKAGNATLRGRCRAADMVVLATRCATHAATGFIADNAKKAQIVYANGSGSGSMLRAIDDALAT